MSVSVFISYNFEQITKTDLKLEFLKKFGWLFCKYVIISRKPRFGKYYLVRKFFSKR